MADTAWENGLRLIKRSWNRREPLWTALAGGRLARIWRAPTDHAAVGDSSVATRYASIRSRTSSILPGMRCP